VHSRIKRTDLAVIASDERLGIRVDRGVVALD
jgi:hypothetical protein